MRNDHRTDAEKEVGASLLKNYGEFFKKQYQDFQSVFGDGHWSENKTYLPIQVDMKQQELLPITYLVSSDNTLMTKVLSVLSSLCVEVITLKQEAFNRLVIQIIDIVQNCVAFICDPRVYQRLCHMLFSLHTSIAFLKY